MMMALYSLVIIGSALLASWAGLRLLTRLARELNFPAERAQFSMAGSMMGFLTVVSVPAGALIGALLLCGVAFFQPALAGARSVRGYGLLLAASLLTVIGLSASPGMVPAAIPPIAALAVAAVILFAMLHVAQSRTPSLRQLTTVTLAAQLPIMVAPLLYASAHSSLALDGAIMLAALLGGLLAVKKPLQTALLLRLPVVLLLGYNALQAAHYGAWPMAVASLLIWSVGTLALSQRLQAAHG